MKDRIDGGKREGSYFAAGRRRRRRYIIMIGIPVVAVAIVLGVFFGTQASEQGIGAGMVLHTHPRLSVNINGEAIPVPEKIGIERSLYKDHSLDKYGMQGMAPLHTHDNSGTIHVESNVNRDFTLEEFLRVWGGLDAVISGKTVKVSVNGEAVSDWRNHVLKDNEQINLEIG